MYALEAIMGDSEIISELETRMRDTTRQITLCPGVSMLPLSVDALACINKDDDEISLVNGFENLSVKLFSILLTFSKIGRLGYCEAEYFGGEGSQSSIALERSEEVFKKIKCGGAINSLLSFLGIRSETGKDEFDTVDLGRKRRTEDWI